VLRYRLEQAEAENARLKAEVEIQNQRINREDKDVAKLYRENARLKADIERLTSDLQMEKENEDRLVRLHQDARNEVERLKRAGDAMANNIPYYADVDISAETLREFTEKWNAAKEGKQS
jgi:cell division septum initiation protein DivIVA